VSKVEVVVEAAHRFRPSGDGPDAKMKLGLFITQNAQCFEPRDVDAWAAYLQEDLQPTPGGIQACTAQR
jgi:hypothetical protein